VPSDLVANVVQQPTFFQVRAPFLWTLSRSADYRVGGSRFIFDPLRRALLLFGGDKSGRWERWYQEAIPQADALYDEYLQES